MELAQKLDILMALAGDDREGAGGAAQVMQPPRLRNAQAAGALRPLNIRQVRAGSTGPRLPLLRILMTNACSFNCHYCPMRRDRNLPRTLLKPAEMVRIFLDAHRRGWCSGLFITTGIPGRPSKVADDLIQVLELLRLKHGFNGYIHVKLVPGADDAQIARLVQLASRVSLNFETPCGASLEQIAPDKSFDTTLVTLQRARARILDSQSAERDGRPRDAHRPGGAMGMTTQFVVGATSDDDRTIIGRVTDLYRGGGVHHAHFSAFRPIRETPLENVLATPAIREHRLYQADHLMRQYRFTSSELVFDDHGNLPLATDPKVAAALARPSEFPVDVITASWSQLVRVPGVGPMAARRIINERRGAIIRGLRDLKRLGVITERAAGFLALRGKRLGAARWTQQLSLWTPEEDAGAYSGVYEFSPGTFR